MGDFFKEMSFIVIATLFFSLVEGVFILPAHVAHSKALNKESKPNKFMRVTSNFMNWMKINYINHSYFIAFAIGLWP